MCVCVLVFSPPSEQQIQGFKTQSEDVKSSHWMLGTSTVGRVCFWLKQEVLQ